MAADDDKNEAPDPWADLVADDLGGAFEPLPEEPLPEEVIAEEVIAEEAVGSIDDEDVGAWLTSEADDSSDADAESAADADAAPPLSVFAPEEAATEPASQSSIEIGTGFSGIDMAADEEGSTSEAQAEGLDGWGGFEAAAPIVAAEATAVSTPSAAAMKPRAKGGGLGPMIGVVAGGVMAIPITMAILLWGFQRDPFGVAKQVPESIAFLLPQKFRPGFKKRAAPSAGMPAAPSLDDLPVASPAPDAPPPDAGEPIDEVASSGDEPPALPDADAALPDAALPDAALPDADPLAPAGEPETLPAVVETEPSDPLFPDPDAPTPSTSEPLASEQPISPPVAAVEPAPTAPPVPPAPPAPPPLDIAAFEAAVAKAATALDAATREDLSGIAGKKLLVGWYRSLARAADELVRLENEAADTGRPLEGTQERLQEIHSGIAAAATVSARLPTLAGDWLEYARRDSEGILLPVTFDSARKVGPYWRSKVQLGAGDDARELAIITREEPSAAAGDVLIVTGIVFDRDVIWAADVRSSAAEPATVDF